MGYTTKELSPQTWPAFERLFSQGGGWDFCACMLWQRGRHLSSREFPGRPAQREQNHREKRRLVDEGRAHGILVFDDDEPVGWCQYGRADELPLAGLSAGAEGDDGGGRHTGTSDDSDQADRPDWRVTCFVTHKQHRRRGVAAVALRAALASIARHGGGVVEAYPIVFADGGGEGGGAARGAASFSVQGVGPVAAPHGTFGNVSATGTVSMFEDEGFKAVRAKGRSQVVMQKRVRARRSTTPT